MLHSTYDDADGIRVHVLTATGPIEQLDDMVADAAKWAWVMVEGQRIVLDLYAWSAGPLGDADELAGAIRDALDASPLPATVRRVVVVAGRVGSERMSSLRHHSVPVVVSRVSTRTNSCAGCTR